MGAWNATSFGNDTANDWAYELEGFDDLTYIESTLQKVIDAGDEYLEAPEAEEGIAAAEVLAWLLGKHPPADAYTEKIADWVAAHPARPSEAMIEKALLVLKRIQQEPSELMELWEGDPAWTESVADLQDRLVS